MCSACCIYAKEIFNTDMKTTYEIEVAGVKRTLRLYSVNENLKIAAFILFGDVELAVAGARELLKKAPEFDILVTAEAKSIPLIFEMARQSGNNDYIVARKSPKVYMENLLKVSVNSITTKNEQSLCIGDIEISKMKGKRCLIVDDVISTGESLEALEKLVREAGGNIIGKMAVLAEGDAINRKDITVLGKLPLFDKNGEPID